MSAVLTGETEVTRWERTQLEIFDVKDFTNKDKIAYFHKFHDMAVEEAQHFVDEGRGIRDMQEYMYEAVMNILGADLILKLEKFRRS